MVSDGDVIEIKLHTRILGVECLNVFHYEVSGLTGSPTPAQVKTAFDSGPYTPLINAISGGVTLHEIEITDLDDTLWFGADDYGGNTGAVTGDYSPAFVTAGFKYVRANRAYRNGFKRFSGVPESGLTNGVVNSGQASLYATLASALVQPLSVGTSPDVMTLTPIILSRTVNGQPRPTPVKVPVSNVVFAGIGSQNTRKQ